MVAMLVVICAYLAGSIPFGYIYGRVFRGIDIRQHGSGNIGATNVARVIGMGPGLVTFIFDFVKGLLPPVLSLYLLELNLTIAVLSGVAAITGHIWPVYLRFKGGRAVLTSAGSLFAFIPWPVLIAFGAFLFVAFITRRISLGSIVASCVLPGVTWYMKYPAGLTLFSLACAVVVVLRHAPNIRRLLHGQEPPFSFSLKDSHTNLNA